mmetsp:Transcript_39351/g.50815  ORF Transcript_39351/g.50815 Transcript_39351/m.50815 type:complete len:83 (+) Transcript_39351:129-377(+)
MLNPAGDTSNFASVYLRACQESSFLVNNINNPVADGCGEHLIREKSQKPLQNLSMGEEVLRSVQNCLSCSSTERKLVSDIPK